MYLCSEVEESLEASFVIIRWKDWDSGDNNINITN